MNKNIIYNKDCLKTMEEDIEGNSIDLILTSPPYNTSRLNSKDKYDTRYDVYIEGKSHKDFKDWTLSLFSFFDKVLKENSIVLYNCSYSSESPNVFFQLISSITNETNFVIADMIIWKKKSALPNNVSPNKLTRIIEPVFVFCRENEIKTFKANKKVVSRSRTGQAFYENIFNFIEAKNNDGVCKLNSATFSSELVMKLLPIYVPKDKDIIVYDPFMGTGTTAIGCMKYGVSYIGSEISTEQCLFAKRRIKNLLKEIQEGSK